MRTSADEVSIHALSPESTVRAASARASEASASTAASASDERTHQYPAPKDRCLLSIVPPEVEEIVSNGGATTRRGGSTGNRRARARSRGHRCPVSGHSLLFVQRQARLGPGAQPPDVAVPERDEGGHDEGRGLEPEPTPLATVAPPLQQAVREETDRRAHTEQPRHRPERPLRRRIRRRGSSDEALVEAPRQVTLRCRKALELPADALEIRGARRLGPLRERAHLLVELAHLVGDASRRRAH